MSSDLINGFLDGDLEPVQLAELDRLLRHDVEVRQELARRMRLHWLLAVKLRSQRGSALQKVNSRPLRRLPPANHRRLPRAYHRRLPAVAIAALVLVTVLAALVLFRPTAGPPDWRIAEGSVVAGGLTYQHGILPIGRDLEAGTAAVHLRWGESTIIVASGSRLRVPDPRAPHLRLESGRLDLTVTPQPAQMPMLVTTPHGTVTVLGTRFSVTVGLTTAVAVVSGRVQVSDEHGTEKVVESGNSATLGQTPSDNVPRVLGFTLVDVATVKVIRPLRDGDRLDLSRLPPKLTVFAEVAGPVGSVDMRLNGKSVRVRAARSENSPPFSLRGNEPKGELYPWKPTPGRYRLSATPYTAENGRGTAGSETAITIEVSP